ncbi:toll/interleukin-1 receptor domain-containing protein [Haloarchaeobius sp. FL176]|uniref:toll/interleukin-1 receptor domain-containing protein n=1 Tax=Haloarchaeobius sp. FL176 TaxID=2967129 RepID=UPI0021497BEF|nr:toll/interleukin-1 receptor domain-containing protein [Haloarchaeobius sp. FL176]
MTEGPEPDESAEEREEEYDVMISYSHEDSKPVANGLYDELTAYGLDVWYDGVELGIGDNIRSSIDRALTESEHAIILISPSYFEGMSEWELDGLVQKHNKTEENVILPLLHGMEFEELQEKSPSLANIIGDKVNEDNIDEITAKLYDAIKSPNKTPNLDDVEGVNRVELNVTIEDLVDISKGSKVTVEEWRTSGTPHTSGVTAVKLTVEESGLTYTGSNFVGTTKVIKDEQLEGHVSDIEEKSAGSTEFTLRLPESRLNELSDDRNDYKSGFVR